MLFGTRKNPKGPSLENPEKIVLDLSGSIMSFSVPRTNYKQRSFEVEGLLRST
ncbi:hypothetical protein GCM10007877_37890 [Marinibactrum halimedae]|uniref:Uncharacterized protein n=1 Tax=Marinibactrum halimedae TaxID=1444977 RepID=A0AA37WP38_9GAMM|nr:hypothetical protein GCM10007877_37890 [Marinibactrum halimedae]